MKKLLVIIFALASSIVASAQTPAQIAKQQIERNVKLPTIVVLLDTSYIRTLNLDKVIMELHITSNGRVKTGSVRFINPSITPINDIFLAATKKVKLPKELISKADTLTIGIQLIFEDLNYKPTYNERRSIKINTPSVNPKTRFYEREIKNQPRSSPYWSYGRAMAEAKQILSTSTLQKSQGGKGAPRFKVTLSEESTPL